METEFNLNMMKFLVFSTFFCAIWSSNWLKTSLQFESLKILSAIKLHVEMQRIWM